MNNNTSYTTISHRMYVQKSSVARREAQGSCCDAVTNRPQGWLLDKMAEEKLTGKYNVRRSNKCSTCNTFRSVNGSCMCD